MKLYHLGRRFSAPAALFALLLALMLCACQKTNGSAAQPAAEPDPTSEAQMTARVLSLCEAIFSSPDAEAALARQDICLLIPYSSYPSFYLENAQPLYAFCEALQEGQDTQITFARLKDQNTLCLQVLSNESGFLFYACIRAGKDGAGGFCVSQYEHYPVQDWRFTEAGNFYYRLFPAGDKHYADFSLIRANAPDETLLSLLEQYVLPIDYYYVNLLITDWREGDWEDVSFNDVFDRLYALTYGFEIDPSSFSYSELTKARQIPAEAFESVILPYFSISRETLRALAGFDAETQTYPWREIQTNDMEHYYYPAIEACLTDAQENTDGTLTLFVSCLSTDIPGDCIFSHQLTIRPLKDGGGFQYVSNKITAQTEYGLPNAAPRLQTK